eukprot:6430102-Amphidinium_carterae.1
MAGGDSDSAIRQKLAKKATQAGVQHANDLLQLIWGDNSSELHIDFHAIYGRTELVIQSVNTIPLSCHSSAVFLDQSIVLWVD